MKRFLLTFVCVLSFSACSTKNTNPQLNSFKQSTQNPLSPEETKELVKDVADNWFYGQGLGDTAFKIGATVAFPPYALVLLGNAVLGFSGNEPVGVENLIPGEAGEEAKRFYDSVTSIPGRVNSLSSGEKFRTPEDIEDNMQKYLKAKEV